MTEAATAAGVAAGVLAALKALFSKSEDVIGKSCTEWSKKLLEKGLMLFERLVQEGRTIEEAIEQVSNMLMILVQKTAPGKETSIEVGGYKIAVKKQKCK